MPDIAPRSAVPRRLARLKEFLACLLLVTTGCAANDPSAAGSSEGLHIDGEGPLSASSGEGGNSIFAPKGVRRWFGTFGSFVLCREDEINDPLVLDSVRVRPTVKPITVTPYLRAVTADQARAHPGASAPFYTTLGSPPDFTESYVGSKVPGQFSKVIRGTRIDQSCDQARAQTAGWTELLLTMKVNRSGGRIDNAFVDYHVGDDARTLHIRWTMVACGTHIIEKDVC